MAVTKVLISKVLITRVDNCHFDILFVYIHWCVILLLWAQGVKLKACIFDHIQYLPYPWLLNDDSHQLLAPNHPVV